MGEPLTAEIDRLKAKRGKKGSGVNRIVECQCLIHTWRPFNDGILGRQLQPEEQKVWNGCHSGNEGPNPRMFEMAQPKDDRNNACSKTKVWAASRKIRCRALRLPTSSDLNLGGRMKWRQVPVRQGRC